MLNEGSIDLSNVDEAKAEQNELFAYISKHSLKPPSTTTTAASTASSNNSTFQRHYNASNLNETNPYINNIIVTSTPATSFSTSANGTSSLVSSATSSPVASSTAAGSPPLRFCPLRFDGYLCWPRTPAGTVLSQYCPDFVEGFNRKFLAHKT